ncbi:hypothetical protein EBH_0039460 [Eimeria brunetti]|uniref:Uncharacterized protein n=1 Tax=Eimeria brunetti TaxID=51314 RepID=U6LGN0_9EIME|nr:hypothetical protein EBH_0039460 [Eimeria brunetti]
MLMNTPALAPMVMPAPEPSGLPANHQPRQASTRGGRSILRYNTEDTPAAQLLRTQEQFQKAMEFALHTLASIFDRSLPSSYRRGVTWAPPEFNGERPTEWPVQINQYYNALQMNGEARLAGVASFLTGIALSYYCKTKGSDVYEYTIERLRRKVETRDDLTWGSWALGQIVPIKRADEERGSCQRDEGQSRTTESAEV